MAGNPRIWRPRRTAIPQVAVAQTQAPPSCRGQFEFRDSVPRVRTGMFFFSFFHISLRSIERWLALFSQTVKGLEKKSGIYNNG